MSVYPISWNFNSFLAVILAFLNRPIHFKLCVRISETIQGTSLQESLFWHVNNLLIILTKILRYVSIVVENLFDYSIIS